MTPSPIPAGPKGFVVSEGEDIYYESWGEGEVVVLTHGMGGNHAIWYQQVAALAVEYGVVTWDQRGFGRSTNRSGDIGPGPSVRDLRAILDHLDVGHAHLIGQSMGGWATLGYAIVDPGRAVSIVLADTIGGIFTPSISMAFDEFAGKLATAPSSDGLPLGLHPAVGAQLVNEDPARSFLYSQIGGLAGSPSPLVITELLASTDHTRDVEHLTVPVLFVVGENDPIFPPSLIEQAASLVPNSEVATIDDTGHSPYFERPSVWNDIVVEFLGRCSLERS